MKKTHQIFLAILILPGLAAPVYAQFGRWAEPVNLSNNEFGSLDPDMAIGPDGKIHVVWDDFSRLCSMDFKDILYAVYDGEAWSEPVQLSAYEITYSKDPHIAIDSSGRPHVVWYQNYIFYNPDVYYTSLTDTGWLEPVNLTTETYSSLDPDIVIDSNDNIHLVWTDYCFGNGEIVHSYYDGNEWSDLVNVSNDLPNSAFPRIELDTEDNIHLVWVNLYYGGSDLEVYYSKYENGSWDSYTNVSQNPSLQSKEPAVALDNLNYPHVVWAQSQGGGYKEIYYSYFDGLTWTAPEDITNLGLVCDYPSLKINSINTKYLLFSVDSDIGDPHVNYSINFNSHWTYPDTIFSYYPSNQSAITLDENDILHACIPMPFPSYCYADIGYTYFQPANSISVDGSLMTESFSLKYYPNPFNNIIQISFRLFESSEVNLSIYNINGQIVKILEDNILPAGEYINYWNGTNRGGKEVSGGVYFIRLQVNDESTTNKIIYLK